MDMVRRCLLILLILKDHTLKLACGQIIDFLPTRIDALEGSCIVIPCKFTYTTPKLTWFKNQSNSFTEIYNSYNSSLIDKSFKGRASFVGNLAKGNCSLKIEKLVLSDGHRYFPLITSGPPPTSVTPSQIVDIRVSSNPEPMALSNPGTMTEGKKYYVTCSAKHTCPTIPPKLSWTFRKLSTTNRHEDLPDGQWRTVSVVTYYPKSEDNGKRMQCTSTYPNRQKSEKSLSLKILYAPKMVLIDISDGRRHSKKGEEVILTCLGNSNPSITHYTWYKNNQTLSPRFTDRILHIEKMTEADSGEYYCEVNNSIGESRSEPVFIHCADCKSLLVPIVGGVTGGIVLLLAVLSVALVKLKRKKRKTESTSLPVAEEAYNTTNMYMNIMVPHKPEFCVESPYTALENLNRCPEYDQLQLQDCQATTQLPLQRATSYSEYEEITPYIIQHNRSWKK